MITAIDQLRSAILRNTLSIDLFARIYRQRYLRTLFLFCISLTLNALLLISFPRFAMYWGPFILGVPHLIASVRATSLSASERSGIDLRRFSVFFILLGIATGILKFIQIQIAPDLIPNGAVESLAIFASVGWLSYYSKKITLGMMGIAALFVAGFLFDPLYFTLLLLIGHNFFAFVFWFREAKTRPERWVPVVSVLLLLLTLAIIYPFSHPDEILADSLFGDRDYLPNASFMITLFLLSQSAHYFIWLKAIPDYQNSSETPAPFSTTLKNIRSELGSYSLHLCGLTMLVILACIQFTGLEGARMAYLYIAAFHGLGEIAVLGMGGKQA